MALYRQRTPVAFSARRSNLPDAPRLKLKMDVKTGACRRRVNLTEKEKNIIVLFKGRERISRIENTVPTQNSDIFVRQKRCHYFGKCHYLGCHYYEWA